MRKQVILSLFLITTLMGQAVAIPLIVPLIVGGVIGGGAMYAIDKFLLGADTYKEKYEELLAEYEALKKNNTIEMYLDKVDFISTIIKDEEHIYLLIQDTLQYSRGYVWSIAKKAIYNTLKFELTQNGSSFAFAKEKARNEAIKAVKQYYINRTISLIAKHNDTIIVINKTVHDFADNIKMCDILFEAEDKVWWVKYDHTKDEWVKYEYDSPPYQTILSSAPPRVITKSFTLDDDITFDYIDFEDIYWLISYSSGNQKGYSPIKYIKFIDNNFTVVYNLILFRNTLNSIKSEYDYFIDNIDAYVNGLSEDFVNTLISYNTTELLDPITLATLFSTDFNSTGYYAFAVAELALAGLPCNGLNTSVNITIYNETGHLVKITEGWLFTDAWDNITVGKNYTVPSNKLVLFADEQGLWQIPAGYIIHINGLTNLQTGRALNSTTIVKYVDHSGDITKMYEELEKLRQLYEQYLEMKTTVGGGSSGNSWANSINDFIANLSWEAKLFIGVCMGAVVLAVIGRSFGRGGVSVIKMGK